MDGPVVAATNTTSLTTSPSSTSLLPAFSPIVLVDYLTEVLSITLGATKRDLEVNGSILSDARYSETLSKCSRFAAEPIVALYASKDVLEREHPEDVICTLFVAHLFVLWIVNVFLQWLPLMDRHPPTSTLLHPKCPPHPPRWLP